MAMTMGMRLPDKPRAVAEARRALDGFPAPLRPDQQDDLRLLVTELVTNAMKHAGGWIELRLIAEPDVVRVEVTDAGEGFDPNDRPDPDVESTQGRGLLLVEQLASRWGVQRGPENKVWFELQL